MPGGVLFGSSSPVDLLSTFPLQVHLSQPVTLSLSATSFHILYFYCQRESYGYHLSGGSIGHPSGFRSCDMCTTFSPTAAADDGMSTISLFLSSRYLSYPTL